MANWSNEAEAREQIKALVAEYYHDFKEKKADFKPGDRVTYASRVFDEKEMCALTDATLDFWLTTGRFADEFEKEFAKWIGVKFANLVNSGSSANLIAFMALTAPELERLLLLLDREPALRGAALGCFADSGLPGAFDRLKDIDLHDPDPALRELAAARLEGRAGDETFRLLDAMMADPSPAVRERAARSMATRGEAGADLLKSLAGGGPSQKQKLARRHLLLSGS